MKCRLCPRQCNAIRTANDNVGGVCAMPESIRLARAALHFWEEPSISGKNGSGTVFFSGCPLHCVFCQNSEISTKNIGKTVTPEKLADIFKNLEQQGAHNINLVTPTHYVPQIVESLNIYKPNIPIVYNTSGYETVETIKILKDYVDIYLFDFKYIDPNKAKLYSNAENYPEICKYALLEAYSQQSECVFDESGIMQKGVIVRHLLMPAATNDAIAVFDWVRSNTPNVFFSLMSQYIPIGRAKDMPFINRKITDREYNKVVEHIINSNFENCYIQEKGSATTKFIPDFDFTGI
ncbi:MAG: radical SAM protein [Clostridia bacterium]|nr:radical SAM protein [Clostridia bacterium]